MEKHGAATFLMINDGIILNLLKHVDETKELKENTFCHCRLKLSDSFKSMK